MRRRLARSAVLVAASLSFAAAAQVAAPPTGSPPNQPEAALPEGKQAPAASPWHADVVYKLDLLHLTRPRLTTGVGHLDATLNVDADALFGWPQTTLRLEAISDQGGRPNASLRTVGGISNLEVAERSARLYSLWVARDFAPGWNLLAGLYDLNSEFYNTDASALLIHPSFGIGTDFSQSGRNGPSIFPNLSLAVRLRAQAETGRYLQVAVLDGVAGDPGHPGNTVVRISRADGALVVAEGGWQSGSTGMRAGLGLWGYSQPVPRLDGTGEQRNRGAYVVAQQNLLAGPMARTTAFLRAGVADGAVNAVRVAADAGVLVERPLGAAGPAALTVGITTAHFGSHRKELGRRQGEAIATAETVVEVGLRWRLGRRWAVQPLAQRIWNAGGRLGVNASVIGTRLEWALSSAPGS